MKWIGIPLIMLCSYLAGKGLCSRSADRVRLLSELCGFIQTASGGMRAALLPLDRIIGEAAQVTRSPGFLRICNRRLREGESFPDAWSRSLEESPEIKLLADEERAELERLGGWLGCSDLQGELALLGQAMDYFSARRDSARTELRDRSGMYMTCSLLTGLTVVLMLL